MRLHHCIILTTSALLASQVGTQVLALQAHYAPILGTPLMTFQAFYQTHGLYGPWQGWAWAAQWGWQAPEVMHVAGLATLIPLAFGCLLCLRQRDTSQRSTPPPMSGHGTT